MSYSKLINRELNSAFVQLKDLAAPVTFVKKSVSGYNFASQSVSGESSENIETKAIVINSKKQRKGRQVTSKQILLKRQDIGDINLYDSVIINGVSWTLAAPLLDNGYLVTAEIFLEK